MDPFLCCLSFLLTGRWAIAWQSELGGPTTPLGQLALGHIEPVVLWRGGFSV